MNYTLQQVICCECESVSVCVRPANAIEHAIGMVGMNSINSIQINIKNPHHVPECVMPSKVVLMV